MASGSHLELMQRIVAPADEWKPDGCCWVTMRVAEGFGYCFQGCLVRELPVGHAVIMGPGAEVVFRASRLGELRLEFFHVNPERLTGLITAMEWRQLEQLYSQGTPLVFHHTPDDALARKFGRLAALQDRGSLQVRTAMLQSWASCVADVLPPLGIPEKKNLVIMFRRFLSEISEKELATISITEMAAQLNSSERHLSRLFRTEFGMSLRDKQAELNIRRACDLLRDPCVNKLAPRPDASSQDGVSVEGSYADLSQPDLPQAVSKMGGEGPAADVAMVQKPGGQSGKTQ